MACETVMMAVGVRISTSTFSAAARHASIELPHYKRDHLAVIRDFLVRQQDFIAFRSDVVYPGTCSASNTARNPGIAGPRCIRRTIWRARETRKRATPLACFLRQAGRPLHRFTGDVFVCAFVRRSGASHQRSQWQVSATFSTRALLERFVSQ